MIMQIGTVILRVILGLIFFIHGLVKFQGGIGNTVGFFDSVGIPGFMAYIVGGIELIGGIAMMIGLGTQIIAVLFAIILLGAIFTVKLSAGFLNGGYELDLMLLAVSIHLVLTGKTPYSVDSKLKAAS
ncbi:MULTISPECIES: DoxX family protein [Bacillaceae]|uniref:Oxidoreductase n=2 Tax=Domibacillus aminovorans TaxID=29332 RepID=A0A177KMY0_9BACI|nr:MULTISPECIES: DoxX family protein [Bacillaceae]OAH54760.1 oxidoreductase [Domibacillus aminovorans]